MGRLPEQQRLTSNVSRVTSIMKRRVYIINNRKCTIHYIIMNSTVYIQTQTLNILPTTASKPAD